MRIAAKNLSCRTLIDTTRRRLGVSVILAPSTNVLKTYLLTYENVWQNCDSNETAQVSALYFRIDIM